MRIGELVRHKTRKETGVIVEIKKDRAFVNWSDFSGVRFRWARLSDLEVINESR